ncbi:MAG: cob(I)yrinic acid a,c-diamide adenosyltransferase [Bacteroidia bacterium]
MAKIYTKTGDKGQTSLIGGTRVSKNHLRIETYGTVDELNSWVGLIRDQQIPLEGINILKEIQDRLFTIGSSLASDPEKSRMKIPDLKEEDILFLENKIDKMNEQLSELKSFILPGGNTVVSYCHIARCVCRRAERLIIALAAESFVDEKIIKYLNRLSDFLFVLARFIGKHFNASETEWKPRM